MWIYLGYLQSVVEITVNIVVFFPTKLEVNDLDIERWNIFEQHAMHWMQGIRGEAQMLSAVARFESQFLLFYFAYW